MMARQVPRADAADAHAHFSASVGLVEFLSELHEVHN